MYDLTIIGGGLAGCEAAWQAARRGINVRLFEMRPWVSTGAHTSGNLSELVCSNSLGTDIPDRASGMLKAELRQAGSLIMQAADHTAVPAGSALAVDREEFSSLITSLIVGHPTIEVIREEVRQIPDGPCIIASGPLTSAGLAEAIKTLTKSEHLFFYDAIAPLVQADSIDKNKVFIASRYGKGNTAGGDYLNCPLTSDQYEYFTQELAKAERIALKTFEAPIEGGVRSGYGHFFEGCLPVEVLARRSRDALAYGPLRPVGLRDPQTGLRPYAVVQLRQDNLAASLYNMVGFQTNLTYSEQKRVFRLIPGLEHAEFARFGQMHRNTFIASPVLLKNTLQFMEREDLFFAGQITGIEGYIGNAASGWLAGVNSARLLTAKPGLVMPDETMLGSLCRYITTASLEDFQPMKANFGILPLISAQGHITKQQRYHEYSNRGLKVLETYLYTMEEDNVES